jgi:hypothetical protein
MAGGTFYTAVFANEMTLHFSPDKLAGYRKSKRFMVLLSYHKEN